MLNATELDALSAAAVDAAHAAAELIARSQPGAVERKAAGTSLASEVVTEVDRASEAVIVDTLRPTLERFDLGLLTEEQSDDGGRLTHEYFWCVDPLDGTLPFIEGTPGYAVSIALVRRDGVPMVGVVHDPTTGNRYRAIAGAGATRNDAPFIAARGGPVLSVFADRSFLTMREHEKVAEGLDRLAQQRALEGVELHLGAGAVMNACGVIENGPACYLKLPAPRGGGSLWDFAATACIATEAGAVATDVHGGRLDLNRPGSTSMNHAGVLYASDRDLACLIQELAR